MDTNLTQLRDVARYASEFARSRTLARAFVHGSCLTAICAASHTGRRLNGFILAILIAVLAITSRLCIRVAARAEHEQQLA